VALVAPERRWFSHLAEISPHAQCGAEGPAGPGDGTGSSETCWRIGGLCIPESVGGGQPMCNLHSMTKSRNEVSRLFKVGHNGAVMLEGRDAIFPGHSAPVVRLAEDGERELATLTWRTFGALWRETSRPFDITNALDSCQTRRTAEVVGACTGRKM